MDNVTYDALVIGSGAAGSFAAKELTGRGLKVILLEAGRFISKRDFSTNERASDFSKLNIGTRIRGFVRGQHIQARYMMFKDKTMDFFVNDRENPYSTPLDAFYLWLRGRQLGGRLHTWGRCALRMSDLDFNAASHDGQGPNWPVRYHDLEPYYGKVENFLGIYGSEENIPQLPDNNYCQRKELTSIEKSFKEKVESKWSDRYVIPTRLVKPNFERVPLPILEAQKTGLLTIQTDAVVKRVLVDPNSGNAVGAEYIDTKDRKSQSISARIVVVCASTIESIRLLLNSACSKHPNGLGNSSGNLGRYFMDQNGSIITGWVPNSFGWERDENLEHDEYASAAGLYIPRFRNIKEKHEAFVRGYGIQGGVGDLRVSMKKHTLFGFMAFGETLPYFENRVTVHPSKKDAWGIPIAHVDFRFQRNEMNMMADSLDALKEIVQENVYITELAGNCLGLDKSVLRKNKGIKRCVLNHFAPKTIGPGSAIHECGGIRMGGDPSTSVLNKYNQCWDVKNLFVTDGSCFPTSGSVGPTLTIMALTVRASEYIADECGKGNL